MGEVLLVGRFFGITCPQERNKEMNHKDRILFSSTLVFLYSFCTTDITVCVGEGLVRFLMSLI